MRPRYKSMSFSFDVDPYVSIIEKIIVYSDDEVKCYCSYRINKRYYGKGYGKKKYNTKHIYADAYTKRPKLDSACEIVKNHHSDMKDDPERLTTDFLLKLINTECKGENKT